MRRKKCRRPQPTAPPPSRDEEENVSMSSATSTYRYDSLSSRLIGSKTAFVLRRPRPQGDPPLTGARTPSQGRITNKTEDVLFPGKTSDSNPSMRGAASGRSENGTEDGLKPTTDNHGEGIQRRRPSTTGSTCARELCRPVEKHPLKHNGRWVLPEYVCFKELPWTGYWTCCGDESSKSVHCLDFDAHMGQREADCLQGLVNHVAGTRRQASKKIRMRWENQMHETSSMSKSTIIEKVAVPESRRPGTCPRRPFLRQKWLDRSNKVGKASTGLVVEAEGARNTFLDSSTTSGSGVKRRIVERHHIRSVVQLARSEARVNAFVVISIFEGLLDVAAVQAGEKTPTTGDDAEKPTGSKITGGIAHGGSFISNPSQRGYIGSARTLPTEFAQDNEDARAVLMPESKSAEIAQRSVTIVASTTTACASGSTNGDKSGSGAELCAKLGAIPVVLECMDEHADDVRIEHLGIKLLRIFAADASTRKFIAGNTNAVKICVSRITKFPIAGVTAKMGEDTVHSSLPRYPFTREQHTTGADRLDRGGRLEYAERHQAPSEAASGITVASKDQDLDSRSCESNSGDGTVVPQSRTKTSSTQAAAELENRGAVTLGGTPRTFQGPPSEIATRRPERFQDTNDPGATGSTIATDCNSADSTGVIPYDAVDTGVSVSERPVTSWFLVADFAFVLSVALDCSSKCQDLVGEHNIVTIILAVVRRMRSDDGNCVILTGNCLRILELIGMDTKERRKLVVEGCVETTVSIIDLFRSHDEVLATAVRLLILLSDTCNGRSRILKTGGIRAVLAAMRRLVNNTPLQVMVVDMLNTMVKEEPNINDPTHLHYFRVLTETNLLPQAFEDAGKWRERIRRYENDRHIHLFTIARRRLARDHSRAYARSISTVSSLVAS